MRHRASRSSPCCAPAITRVVARLAAEAVRERFAEAPLPLGRRVSPGRRSVAGQHIVDRGAKRGGRKQIERRLAGGERHDRRIGGVPDQIAQRRVGGLDRGRRNLAAPRERRAAVARRRHERAATDVAAHQPLGLELAIRGHDRGAADAERAGQIALRRQPESRRQRAARRCRARSSSTIRR